MQLGQKNTSDRNNFYDFEYIQATLLFLLFQPVNAVIIIIIIIALSLERNRDRPASFSLSFSSYQYAARNNVGSKNLRSWVEKFANNERVTISRGESERVESGGGEKLELMPM